MLIPFKITKEFILSKVSQEEIFERYGVPIVSHKFPPPDFIRTPYNKTCSFFYKDEVLILNDFAYKTFNCFSLVQKKYSCTFNEALLIIANDFGLQKSNIDRKPIIKENSVERQNISYQICKKDFTQKELEFWCLEDYKVEQSELNYFNIYSISDLFINHQHSKGDLKNVFAYRLSDKDFQIYFPLSQDRSKRFRSSISTGIFGLKYLKKGKPVIICKSYKDFFYTQIAGFNSCCVIRENYVFKEEEITHLKSFSEEIFIYFDNDSVGWTCACREAKKWNLKTIFNKEEKDYSDYLKKYNLEKGIKMLNELMK